MRPAMDFESLSGVYPGISPLDDVLRRFGEPIISNTSGGGQRYVFREGIEVFVCGGTNTSNPPVSEVRWTAPCTHTLPCGVRIGQGKAEAIASLRKCHEVIDEYEDAIYFRPSPIAALVASLEFRSEDVVVGIELYCA